LRRCVQVNRGKQQRRNADNSIDQHGIITFGVCIRRVDARFDQRETLAVQGDARGLFELRDIVDDEAVAAVRLGHHHIIGAIHRDPGLRQLHTFLLQLDQRQRVVAEHHQRQRELVLGQQRHFADHHVEPRLAHHREHRALGKHELGGDRRRQRVTHGAETVRLQQPARLVRLPDVIDQDAMRAGVYRGDCVARKHLAQRQARPGMGPGP
jgi:hypothetical protein